MNKYLQALKNNSNTHSGVTDKTDRSHHALPFVSIVSTSPRHSEKIKPFTELACGTCLYFGWEGVKHYCRHPHHDQLIAGVDCDGEDYIDRYRKTVPTKNKDYPEPVSIEQATAT